MLIRYGLPVLALALLSFAFYQMSLAQQKSPAVVPAVEPAKSPYGTQLAGAGLVEPETENISVGTHLPGVVERVFVKVGQTVRSGEPIFQLDDRQVKAEIGVREANVANAEAMLEKLTMMPRPEEIPPIDAKLAEAEANLREQVALLDRYRGLAATNAISGEELVRRQGGFDTANALRSKAKADRDLLLAGAWQYDRKVSEVAVRQFKAQLAQTRIELERQTMKAPLGRYPESAPAGSKSASEPASFNVLQVNVRPGEYVGLSPGQALVVLGFVGKLHVRVDIDENDIARFSPGLVGVAKPRGNPKEQFALSFVRVEPYVIPKRSLTGGNTERVDTRVLQVIYSIDTAGRPLYVGQQMDVFLDTSAK